MVYSHIDALNEELHKKLKEQDQRFWEKEASWKKNLKMIEKKVEKKIERKMML